MGSPEFCTSTRQLLPKLLRHSEGCDQAHDTTWGVLVTVTMSSPWHWSNAGMDVVASKR